MTNACDYDAIIIGAGHNGLTAAAYLAREGRHPGGGVMDACGRNAAGVILRNLASTM